MRVPCLKVVGIEEGEGGLKRKESIWKTIAGTLTVAIDSSSNVIINRAKLRDASLADSKSLEVVHMRISPHL